MDAGFCSPAPAVLSAAMHAIFHTPGSGAIPIYFIDAASLSGERDGLDAAAWNLPVRQCA